MFVSVKKLYRNRRGNVIVIAAAALPLVLGSAGLAADTIQWTLWKRQLQRAADSAAIAGAYARITGASATSAVTTDLLKNNHVWMELAAGYPATTQPANTSTFTNQVSVVLGIQQELPFSSFFLTTTPLITTAATAAAVDDGSYCLIALDNSTTSGVTIGGSANANLDTALFPIRPHLRVRLGPTATLTTSRRAPWRQPAACLLRSVGRAICSPTICQWPIPMLAFTQHPSQRA